MELIVSKSNDPNALADEIMAADIPALRLVVQEDGRCYAPFHVSSEGGITRIVIPDEAEKDVQVIIDAHNKDSVMAELSSRMASQSERDKLADEFEKTIDPGLKAYLDRLMGR